MNLNFETKIPALLPLCNNPRIHWLLRASSFSTDYRSYNTSKYINHTPYPMQRNKGRQSPTLLTPSLAASLYRPWALLLPPSRTELDGSLLSLPLHPKSCPSPLPSFVLSVSREKENRSGPLLPLHVQITSSLPHAQD